MATEVLVNGKRTSLPGVYGSIKSGVINEAPEVSYGKTVFIDTGLGAGFAGGSGVMGALLSGADSFLTFKSLEQLRSVIRGGKLWSAARYLFNPAGLNTGISELVYVKAAETTPATATFAVSGITFTFKTKDEGLSANSTITSGHLDKGFAIKLITGNTAGKYRLAFFVGSYKGSDSLNGNLSYDFTPAAQSDQLLLFQTKDFSNSVELNNAILDSSVFSTLFTYTVSNPVLATTVISAGEISAVGSNYVSFTGGTENYSVAALTRALEFTGSLDNSFFVLNDSHDQALSAKNIAIVAHIQSGDSRFRRYAVIGGSIDTFSGTSTATLEMARVLNSAQVILSHSAPKDTSIYLQNGIINRDAFDQACLTVGLIAGLEPQNSPTFKQVNIKGLVDTLSESEKELASAGGVFYYINDPELGFVAGQAINTLQNNRFLVNQDNTSHDIAVERICAELNKSILIQAKRDFYGTRRAVNRGSLTPEDIKTWLIGLLRQKINDGLIVRVGDQINVSVTEDIYNVDYSFVPNYPVNKIIFTGTTLAF